MAKAVELNGKRILVTFLMHLGDLTLTTPFIHALRKAAPDAHITFLADEKLKDVVLHNPYLDEVVTIDKKGRDNSLLALAACARRLSKMDFDAVQILMSRDTKGIVGQSESYMYAGILYCGDCGRQYCD